jgi:fluoroquinolone transport system ATP-binding protein
MFIADELCDRVAFIVDGEIKLVNSPKKLKLEYGEQLVEVEYAKNGEIATESFSTVLEVDKKRLRDVIAKHDIQSMHTKEATLEEIFIKVTGRGLA